MSLHEAKHLGIDEFDVVLVTGDAYIDHPSFGTAVIGRVLWDAGFSVGIIAQPGWKSDSDLKKLGKPRLFFGVTAGNVDSMVNNYTANLKIRRDDVYSPGGIPKRPNRACIVYSDKLHSIFPDTPIVLGGIEASLRRFAHYDYWSDSVRQSILADAPADMVVFGMGERQVIEIARRLSQVRTLRISRTSRAPQLKWKLAGGAPLGMRIMLKSRGFPRSFVIKSFMQKPSIFIIRNRIL